MRKQNAEWIKSYAKAARDEFFPKPNLSDALDELIEKFNAAAEKEVERLVSEALTDALGGMFLMEGLNEDGHLVMSVCTGDDYRVDFDIEAELLASLNGLDWMKEDCLALARSLRRIADAAVEAAKTAADA